MGRACLAVFFVVYVVVLLPLITIYKGKGGFVLGCHELERQALLKFKGTDNEIRLSSWKGDDCCHWQGVSCNNVTHRVTRLDLRNDIPPPCFNSDGPTDKDLYDWDNFISPTTLCRYNEQASTSIIPHLDQSFLELKELRYLDLSGNFFKFRRTRIPAFIGSMKNLRYLNFSGTSFWGAIPPQLGNLTGLRALDLCRYNPDGSVWGGLMPSFHWISSLVNLRYLDISGISFTTEAHKSLQLLSSLPLLVLRISGVEIDNSLPHLFSNSTLGSTIQHLDLSHTSLEGPFPHFLANVSSLTFLDLSYNHLNGNSLPHLFSNSTLGSTIQHLDLSETSLEGPFPHFLANMSSLTFLDLSRNYLNGSIPLWLSNMRQLEFLNLLDNTFNHVEGGTITGILGNLCNLKVLDLSYNSFFRGEIISADNVNLSKCITYDLERLDLTSNRIVATLPDWFGELRNLRSLRLGGGNKLNGPFPTSFRNLSLLQELDMHDCGLNESLPFFIGELSSLQILDLSNNTMYGSFPRSLGSLSSLIRLDLSFNKQLHLNFSFDWIPKFRLTALRMRSCRIRDQFPQWIKTQNELNQLDLSDNQISGELPAEWLSNFTLMSIFNLSSNDLRGPIPLFPSNSSLSIIDLSFNSFSGPLLHNQSVKSKTSLCNLRFLEFLDLKGNQLVGSIPDCWGNSQDYLYVIDLSSNKLSGTIPLTFGQLPQLTYLKLNNNSLEGDIPLTFEQQLFSDLIILDLGENKLTGLIPRWNGVTHPYLTILRLHSNQLKGVIPPQLCSLTSLQILDIGKNKLTGSIPHCVGQLISMKLTQHRSYDEVKAEENAVLVLKGAERQYTTTLMFYMSLDLSCNDLTGSIPPELTKLSGIVGLNLSYNRLTGSIPEKIGEMRSLESLDLSNNNLSGTIPASLSAITTLSSLNLSCNHLHGEIPTGRQLQTLNDPSIYGGNAGLCGDPLPNTCHNKHGQQQPQQPEEQEKESTFEKVLFYIVVMLGLATGFWGVVGSLLYSKTWRHALFRRVDNFTDFLYVQVVVRINRLKN